MHVNMCKVLIHRKKKGPLQTGVAEAKVWGQGSLGCLWQTRKVYVHTRQIYKAAVSSVYPFQCISGTHNRQKEVCWNSPRLLRELTGCRIALFHLGEAETHDSPQLHHAQRHFCYSQSSSQGPTAFHAYDSPESGSGQFHSMLSVCPSRSDAKTL